MTAIIGAILAANLGLIALDIAAPAAAVAHHPLSPRAERVAGPA